MNAKSLYTSILNNEEGIALVKKKYDHYPNIILLRLLQYS